MEKGSDRKSCYGWCFEWSLSVVCIDVYFVCNCGFVVVVFGLVVKVGFELLFEVLVLFLFLFFCFFVVYFCKYIK